MTRQRTLPTVLKKVVPYVFYGLLVVFLFLYLRSIDFAKLRNIHVNPAYVALSAAFALAFRFWGSFIWVTLLRGLGAKQVRYSRELVYVYAKSWLGRYIPGTAPWILGKIYFAAQYGISKSKLGISSLLEGALQIVASLVLSFAILTLDRRTDVVGTGLQLVMVAALAGCLVALLPPVFNFFVSRAYRLIRRQPLHAEHLAGWHTILRGAAMYVAGAALNGLALFFIAKAVYAPLSYSDTLFVIGTGTFAGAAGMLAIFVPSGIGVRDGIQLAMLSVIMPLEYALVITVIARLWDVIVDLIFFSIAYAFNKRSAGVVRR